MVRKYKDKELLDRVKEVEGFKEYPKGRWILGVRSRDDETNKFDDKFYCYEGTKFIDVVTGTTNPGVSILKNGFKRYNKAGAAIVKADQWYYKVWSFGMHRGKQPGLLQIGNKITVYRDGDGDGKSEELGEPTSGYYGINYHTNTYDFSTKNLKLTKQYIYDWSAGCQVVNQREAYLTQMEWYKKAKKDGTQKFVTYCLINEF